MRQGQQNRRGRGRSSSSSNRKGQSPLTRSFESTGPEVKIRGTPSHIAEKYMSLARDAHTSGDPVLAENYLQHAEHYNRIIMAFRDQQISQGGDGLNGGGTGTARNPLDSDDYGDDEGDDGDMQPQHQNNQPQMRHNDHQPRMDGQRYEGQQRSGSEQSRFRDRNNNNNNNNNSNNNNRQDRSDNRFDRNDRGDRQDRGGDHQNAQPPQPPRQPSAEAGAEASGGQQAGADRARPRDRFPPQQHEQPEFLRRPVRRPRREGNGTPSEVNGAAPADETDHD